MSKKSKLLTIIYIFADQKRYACTFDGCDCRFAIKSDLNDHINKKHTFAKPYQCESCGQHFATRSERSSHKRVHAEPKYRCNMCDKAFVRSAVLKNHINTHTGERPHMCLICQKRFTQVASLQKHIKTHTSSDDKNKHVQRDENVICNENQAMTKSAMTKPLAPRNQYVPQAKNHHTIMKNSVQPSTQLALDKITNECFDFDPDEFVQSFLN